jgi:glycine cleavage system H protein
MNKVDCGVVYTETHEWVRLEGNIATVGISEHAQELLGELVYVELPEIDQEYSAGDEVCVVESVKAASDIYIPVSGKIIEVNDLLSESPQVINDDPYKEGWLIKVLCNDLSELSDLLSSEQYDEKLG